MGNQTVFCYFKRTACLLQVMLRHYNGKFYVDFPDYICNGIRIDTDYVALDELIDICIFYEFNPFE